MPKVSVIIPTHNRAKYICEAIDSVLSQTYKDYEIIVIDDGSTDNTKDVIAKYGSGLKYIYKENKGASSARNTGINLAKGEYLAFLDSDDVWLPEKLEKQIRVIEEDGVGLVYSAKLIMNEEGELTGDIRPYRPAKNLYDLLRGHYINMSVLVRKDLVIRVGLFDESIQSCEDTDLWIRIVKLAKIKFMEEPLIKYRLHSSNKSSNFQFKLANRIIMQKKILKDEKIRARRAIINRRLAKSYYQLGREQYLNKQFKPALRSLLLALRYDVTLFRSFIRKNDRFSLKAKKTINPFAAIFVCTIKSIFYD